MPGNRGVANTATIKYLGGGEEKSDLIVKEFRSFGFKEVSKPNFEAPVMPGGDVKGYNPDQLSDLIAKYSAWREYTQDMLIHANAKVVVLEEEYSNLYNITKLAAAGTATERKEIALADKEVIAAKQKWTMACMYQEMLNGKFQTFTDCLATLSREITLRKY